MAMKKCPVCGEKYSDTYQRCPFCEEEEALRNGEIKHKGGHRVPQHKGPSLLSPILIILIILMAATMVYLLFGDAIGEKLGLGGSSAITSSAASSSASGAASSPAASSSGSAGALSSPDTAGLPDTLKLSLDDFTMNVGDAPVKISVSGTGSYTWSSDNEAVATVDKTGNVTAIAAGTANITASDGSGKGVCIVRVKGSGTPNQGSQSGTATLSQTDATIGVKESFSLKVTGSDADVTWSSDNTSVASVSGGKVTGVARGTANITASVDGKKLTCIVRVK